MKDPYKIATFGILSYRTSIKLEPVVSWTLSSTIFIEKEVWRLKDSIL